MFDFLEGTSTEVHINITSLMIQLVLAFILGTILALHPTTIKRTFAKSKRLQVAKSQILLCVAGALLINVIGDSAARAFGIFGIGSFVRFKAPVKSPMDASLMFMLLGIGMALGLGLYEGALLCSAFLFGILYVLSFIKVKGPKSKNKQDFESITSDNSKVNS